MNKTLNPDFGKMPDGLIPAVVQDVDTGVVLMLGYMNAEALAQTQRSGLVTFYSRTRQAIWTKGETSGNVLRLSDIRLDCDQDTLLIKAHPTGPVCHTGDDTCWGENNRPADFLKQLETIIGERRSASPEISYTARLVHEGIAKIAQKVGEEAVETVIEALGDRREHLLNETADLLYHLLVMLSVKDIRFAEVEEVLRVRHERRE